MTTEYPEEINSLSFKYEEIKEHFEDFIKNEGQDWVEENKIPCRIAFNAIKDVKETEKDIETIRGIIEAYEEDRGHKLQSAFLSDFNFKGERRNDHCYMHMVKP